MKHLIKTLFGADYASLRLGVNVSQITAEENATEDNYHLAREWWDTCFPGKNGVPMGEILQVAASNETAPYMAEIVIAACFKLTQKR